MRKCIKADFLVSFRKLQVLRIFKNSSAFPGKKSNGNKKTQADEQIQNMRRGVAGVLDEVNDSFGKTYRRHCYCR